MGSANSWFTFFLVVLLCLTPGILTRYYRRRYKASLAMILKECCPHGKKTDIDLSSTQRIKKHCAPGNHVHEFLNLETNDGLYQHTARDPGESQVEWDENPDPEPSLSLQYT